MYYVCDCSRAVTNVHPKVYVPMTQEEAMLYIYHLSEDHEGRQCSSYSQKKCVHWTYDLGLTEASPLVTMNHLMYYVFFLQKEAHCQKYVTLAVGKRMPHLEIYTRNPITQT